MFNNLPATAKFPLLTTEAKTPRLLDGLIIGCHRFMMIGHEQNAESSDASSLLTASDLQGVPERRSQHLFNALFHHRKDALMQYKTLGDTGLLVSTICFGCMTFNGGAGFWNVIGRVDQASADALVKGSVDAGVNFFDTADVYSEGESEKTL